mgnify:CR=1 FL=1
MCRFVQGLDKTIEFYDFVRGSFVPGLDRTVEFYDFVHGSFFQGLDKIIEFQDCVHPKARFQPQIMSLCRDSRNRQDTRKDMRQLLSTVHNWC